MIARDGKMRLKVKGIRGDFSYIDKSGAQLDTDTVAADVHKLITKELNVFIQALDTKMKQNFGLTP